MSSKGMVRTTILCPGIPSLLDNENKPITHYLVRDPDSVFQNLVCDQEGCQFSYKTKDGLDEWRAGYIPLVIPK